MGTDLITSRQVIGWFYEKLSMVNESYLNQIAMPIKSDQMEEEYAWLGMTPAMREWVGGRQAKGLRQFDFKIPNIEFEATLPIKKRHMKLDKSGQIRTRINELAMRAAMHPAKLTFKRMLAGASSLCYDGQYFFDTDHVSGDSGTQSNKIQIDISALPVSTHGTPAAPSAAEFSHAIIDAITAMMAFKDDQGEEVNDLAGQFLVMVPLKYMKAAGFAVSGEKLEQGDTSAVGVVEGVQVTVRASAKLTALGNKFQVYRTDGETKPYILQEESDGVELDAIAEGSELEFKTRTHEYGAFWSGNVGYGYWQHAIEVELV